MNHVEYVTPGIVLDALVEKNQGAPIGDVTIADIISATNRTNKAIDNLIDKSVDSLLNQGKGLDGDAIQ